jgi:hypothetical protein
MPRANPHFSTRSRLAIAEDWFKTFKPFNRFARFNAFGRSKFKVQEFKSKLELVQAVQVVPALALVESSKF